MQLCIMHVYCMCVHWLFVVLCVRVCVRARACTCLFVHVGVWVGGRAGIQASGKVTFTPNKQLKLRFDWQENIHYTLSAFHRYLITN